MPIKVVCRCGKVFMAKDEHAGKKARCSACQEVVRIPLANVFVPSKPPEDSLGIRVDTEREKAPDATPRKRFRFDPVVMIGALVPSMILAAFFGYLLREKGRIAFLERVHESKAKADQLVAANDLKAACTQYLAVIEDVETSWFSDSQTDGIAKSSRDAIGAFGPRVREIIRVENEEIARLVEKRRRRAKHLEESERLAQYKGEVAGTVFVNMKSGDLRTLKGTEVVLLKADLPKADLAGVLDRLEIIEGITKTAKTDAVLNGDEVEFFRDSLERAKTIRDEPDDGFVDVRLIYAVAKINLFASRPSADESMKCWRDTVRMARIADTYTSVDGTFRFENVTGGRYYLCASHTENRSIIEWVAPIVVERSGVTRFDLHNNIATLLVNFSQ